MDRFQQCLDKKFKKNFLNSGRRKYNFEEIKQDSFRVGATENEKRELDQGQIIK